MTSNRVLLSALIIAAVTTGCRTDVLRPNRIAGEWNADVYSVNGTNLLASTSVGDVTMTMEFDKDGDFDMTITNTSTYGGSTYSSSLNFTGTWEDEDKDLQLNFDATSQGAEYFYGTSLANAYVGNDGILEETYDIIELERDELTMEATISGTVFRLEADKND